MKSSRESVHRREDWREREGEGDGRAHKLLNLIHCTSCWNMSPSNMKPHSGCVVSFLLFLFSSSLLFLESYFPSFFNFYQFYRLSLLQELFHKHLSAVELALSPWGSRIVFFFFFCADNCVSSAQLHLSSSSCGLSRIKRKNEKRQRLVLRNLGLYTAKE